MRQTKSSSNVFHQTNNACCPRRSAFKVKPSPHRTTFTGTPAAKWSTVPVLPVMLLLRCGAWWWWGRRLGPFIRSGAPACSTPNTSTKSIYAASAWEHPQTPNTCCLSARGIAAGWRRVGAPRPWLPLLGEFGVRFCEGVPQMLDGLERRYVKKTRSHPTRRWGRPALS